MTFEIIAGIVFLASAPVLVGAFYFRGRSQAAMAKAIKSL